MLKRMAGMLTVLSVAATGCATEEMTPASDDLSVESSPIRNGNVVLFPQLDSTVRITTPGKAGSGVLVAANWVLTAAHVIEGIQTPIDVSVTRGNIGDTTAEVLFGHAVYNHPKHVLGGLSEDGTSDVDISLIRLTGSFSNPTIRTISAGANSDFSGTSLLCAGYGKSVVDDPSSAGFLRTASLPVTDFATTWLLVEENNSLFGTQNALKGDSGGPCSDPLTGELVGIVSSGDVEVTYLATAQSFRTWVSDTIDDCSNNEPGTENFTDAKCPGTNHAMDCDPDTCAPGFTCDRNVGSAFGQDPGWDVCVLDKCSTRVQGSDTYCATGCPCGYGGGDCESSPTVHCIPGLVCKDNLGPAFAMKPETDVCVYNTCFTQAIGHKDFCSQSCPCGHGGGDCDVGTCMPGMTCAKDYGAAFDMTAGTDVCVKEGCEDRTLFSSSFCSDECPCGIGGGQCRDNADCMPGLKCGTNNGADFGRTSSFDLCYDP